MRLTILFILILFGCSSQPNEPNQIYDFELDLNLLQMTFLEDTVEHQLKKVTLEIKAEDVNETIMESIFDLIDERGKVKLAFKIRNGEKSVQALSQRYKIQMDEITKKKLNSLGLDFRFN